MNMDERKRLQAGSLDLTYRQKHIVAMLWECGGDRELVVEKLCIAPTTLRSHLDNIYAKLNVNTLAKLLAKTGNPNPDYANSEMYRYLN